MAHNVVSDKIETRISELGTKEAEVLRRKRKRDYKKVAPKGKGRALVEFRKRMRDRGYSKYEIDRELSKVRGLVEAVEARMGRDALDLGEQCYIARRRRGMTQGDLMLALGISRQTIIKRERNRGDVIELARFWHLL